MRRGLVHVFGIAEHRGTGTIVGHADSHWRLEDEQGRVFYAPEHESNIPGLGVGDRVEFEPMFQSTAATRLTNRQWKIVHKWEPELARAVLHVVLDTSTREPAAQAAIETMRLIGQEGEEFQLEVVGYEFPGIIDDEWDSEWLIVAGKVSCARGRWKFRDPCLLTMELEALASWLRDLRSGVAGPELDFIEPNLRFTRVQGSEGEAISVAFSQEASPPWASEDERYGDGYALTFPFSLNDLDAASAALLGMAIRWPMRTRKAGPG